MSSGIYKIVHAASGKLYIGSAINIDARFVSHKKMLRGNRHHSAKLQRAWNKYGATSFTFDVIEYVEDRSVLLAREQAWLDHHAAAQCGYNINPTAGSNLGRKWSEETRARMGASHKGKPRSAEHCAKLSASMTGRVFTADHRANIAATRIGKKLSPETCARMSAAHKGKKFTAEHKAKIGKANARKLKGRVMPAEHRANISRGHLRRRLALV